MRKKKQYIIEEGIFGIYSDFPILVNDRAAWLEEESPFHFHYYLEIGYLLEGSGIFRSQNKIYEMKKGDITVTAGNILHTARALESETYGGIIYIDLEELLKFFAAENSKIQLKMVQESLTDTFFLKSGEHPDVMWMINEITRLYVDKKQNYKMQIIGLLYALLFKVYDIFSEEKNGEEQSPELPILPAIEYIYDHYMDVIKVEELAKCCHFSESYFRKVFMEMKGISPMDYLNSIRVRESCKRLRNTTDSIRVVGEKCGFLSVTTFERNFKQRMGMLPSQYREKCQKPRKRMGNTYEIKQVYYK